MLGALEIVLRYYYYGTYKLQTLEVGLWEAHPQLGWKLRENNVQQIQTLDYTVTSRTNSFGFRDSEREHQVGGESRRIALLGDSFVEGYYVPFENSLSQSMEKELGPDQFEVLNFGVRGYGTLQALLMFQEHAVHFQPNLTVLFFVHGNDIFNNYHPLRLAYAGSEQELIMPPLVNRLEADILPHITYPDYDKNARLIEQSRRSVLDRQLETQWWENLIIVQLGKLAWENLTGTTASKPAAESSAVFSNVDPNVAFIAWLETFDPTLHSDGLAFTEHDYYSLRHEAQSASCAIMSAAKREVEASGSDFLVIGIPSKAQIDLDDQAELRQTFPSLAFNFNRSTEWLTACARAEDFGFFDLTSGFIEQQARISQPLYNQYGDRHWSVRGTSVASKLTLEALRRYVPDIVD